MLNKIRIYSILISSIVFALAMICTSVLLFMQTRDRIYTDMEYRLEKLEIQVQSLNDKEKK